MRPDHSSTQNETLPPSATSAAHAHHSAHAAGGGIASHAAAAAAATASSSSERGMGGSGRVHGGGGERGGGGSAARPMKAVDVPELVLKLCKNILKKERDVSTIKSVVSMVFPRRRFTESVLSIK